MRNIRRTFLAAAVLPVLLAGGAGAQDLGESVLINGFVSQGYLNTHEVDYLIPNSRDGSAELLEAALTVTTLPTDRLRIAAQFLARNFGDTGNGNVVLDWGYGDYRWRDYLGVRAGKVKLPYGLYNEYRDLDFLRTPVFMPQSVYNEKTRDFLLAYEGVGFYGNFSLGGGGALDYHVFGGTLSVPDPSRGFWEDNYSNVAEAAEPLVAAAVEAEQGLPAGSVEATATELADPTVTFPYVYGGALVWETPLEGFRLGATIFRGRFEYQARVRFDVSWTTPEGPRNETRSGFIVDQSDIDRVSTLSAEFARGRFFLAAEYYDQEIDITTNDGWYAAVDFQAADRLNLAVMRTAYYGDKNDRDGQAIVAMGGLAHYAWQKHWTLAARYDLTDSWLIKAEFSFIDGTALSEPLTLEEYLANPLPRDWHMFAARTTFHF
jgi:hypothetical protein